MDLGISCRTTGPEVRACSGLDLDECQSFREQLLVGVGSCAGTGDGNHGRGGYVSPQMPVVPTKCSGTVGH